MSDKATITPATVANREEEKKQQQASFMGWVIRPIAGAVLSLALISYVSALVMGKLPQSQRLGLADVIVVAVVAAGISLLIWPRGLVSAIDNLSVGPGGLQVTLRQLKEHQAELKENQAANSREIDSLILMTLLGENERQYLREIADRSETPHTGSHHLRTELRRLAQIGLIKRKPGRTIHEMRDETSVALRDFVEVTPKGQDYLERLEKVEAT